MNAHRKTIAQNVDIKFWKINKNAHKDTINNSKTILSIKPKTPHIGISEKYYNKKKLNLTNINAKT